ncbi:hypothetical protein ACINLD_05135 [Bacillus sp. z60-11]|uniref:hypothetical protein n=1 Tax=Bacillus sp. z60-11 TaxID=3377704 RepID=UPI00396CF4CF
MKALVKYLIILGIIGAVTVGFIVFNGIHNNDHEEISHDVKREMIKELHTNKRSIASEESEDTKKRDEKNFTLAQFEQRFNDEAKKLEVSSENIRLKVQEGKKKELAVYHFNHNLALTAVIEKKSNKVINVVLFRSGEIEAEGLTEFYKNAAVIMNTFHPEMTKKDRGKLLFDDLEANQVITHDDFSREKRYAGFHYTVEYSKEKLLLLFAVTIPQ